MVVSVVSGCIFFVVIAWCEIVAVFSHFYVVSTVWSGVGLSMLGGSALKRPRTFEVVVSVGERTMWKIPLTVGCEENCLQREGGGGDKE